LGSKQPLTVVCSGLWRWPLPKVVKLATFICR